MKNNWSYIYICEKFSEILYMGQDNHSGPNAPWEEEVGD